MKHRFIDWGSSTCDHMTVEIINPRPAGPLDFPPPAGGGGAFERPPMISAPGRRREKQKAAFESSRKIISKSFWSFFGSGQNWGHQGSKFQTFRKRFFDNKIVNFKGRATNLTPVELFVSILSWTSVRSSQINQFNNLILTSCAKLSVTLPIYRFFAIFMLNPKVSTNPLMHWCQKLEHIRN